MAQREPAAAAAAPMKVAFSIPKSSSSERRPASPPEAPSSSSVEYVTSVDAEAGVVLEQEDTWRAAKRMKNTRMEADATRSTEETFEMETVDAGPKPNGVYGLTVMRTDHRGAEDGAEGLRPTTSLKELEGEKLRGDLLNLPGEATQERDEEMPVEEFGEALVRGMGWEKGKPIGRNAKAEVAPIEFEKRQGSVGLGAVPAPPKEMNKTYIKPGESRPKRRSDLEAAANGQTRNAGELELAPLSKKKRSNTVKRCSAHATGMTFESESDATDLENDARIDSEVKEGSDTEIGDEDVEDGGVALNSEKVNDEAGAGWSEGWAEEDMSMESILEKARQMVAEMSKPGAVSAAKPSKETKQTSEGVLVDIDGQNGKKKKSKKEEERIKREEIFAESQRLLRESKGVSFVVPAPVMKPVSSVLEKIRQRRLQLGCSGSWTGSSQESETKSVSRRGIKESRNAEEDLTVDEATEVEIEVFRSTVTKTEEVKTKESAFDVGVLNKPIQQDTEGVGIVGARGLAHDASSCDMKIPNFPNGVTRDGLASSKSDEEDLWLKPSPIIMDTQDLLCESQRSTAATEEILPFESVGTTTTDLMGLDTQILDEDLMSRVIRDKYHQENKGAGVRPSGQSEVYTTATHVRGLIDDEAEDEDEDILAENAEEEVLGDDEEDLQDLIATNEKEKAGDKARRDALHRKWLDLQDTEQTEDILERLRTGRSTRWKGRDRIVSCLDEDDDTRDSELLDKNSSQAGADEPATDLIEEPTISLRQRARGQELEMDCLLDDYEDADDIGREGTVGEKDEIIEDEEEHEQVIIRQRMLEESEEQLLFLSPADDESSREVLSLITKVNVGNLKLKSSTGPSEIRAASSAPLPSRQSFLGRSSSSSSLPPPAHRHVGSAGNSRSFVFGRDDSNSGHGFPSSHSQEEKKPGISKSVSDKGMRPTSTVGVKKQRPTQPPSGPSLFEMLKKQSKELEQDLQKSTSSTNTKTWASSTEAFSMFATKKSVIPFRRKL